MKKPKILLSEDIHPQGKSLLIDKFELIIAPDTSEATLLRIVPDVFGIILRATSKVNRNVIQQAHNLKVIARTGVGVDNVDIEAASERGIYVCNTPGMNDCTVAEHTVALILGLAKQLFHMDHAVRTRQWQERFSEKQIEVAGRTLGLIGFGAIGMLVARKCGWGLGMKILVYDPYFHGEIKDDFITFTGNLEKLFIESDFISIHAPNVPETRGLVSRKLLALMKETTYLVNTSRGELIDEQALIEMLQGKKIAGAALDVFQKEPLPADSPFNQMKNVILTPHVAGSTWESNVRIAKSAAIAVIDMFEGRTPEFVYNYEKIGR